MKKKNNKLVKSLSFVLMSMLVAQQFWYWFVWYLNTSFRSVTSELSNAMENIISSDKYQNYLIESEVDKQNLLKKLEKAKIQLEKAYKIKEKVEKDYKEKCEWKKLDDYTIQKYCSYIWSILNWIEKIKIADW